ncbi:hypothetical protein EXIGLDRAFT_829719 [Exidia glandulosa HHB12029]|uniref:Vacuolar sorting protein Vps3844 C-terminal domain-containing protein n=1 Tax=Exidia glandulosa HHB12029 TaxID=1314781 RepID=A0A165P857_EXIGL|nr:hypothetical protein EXIGLDRAFT_829719 [Exidia glandulosa HHB12029]
MRRPQAALAALTTLIPFTFASSLYLLPQPDFQIQVVREASASQANVAVEHWLGLDRLDKGHLNVQNSWTNTGLDVESVFGPKKTTKTMLLAVETDNVDDVLPDGLMTTYTVTEPVSASSLVAAYVQKANMVYGSSSVFSTSSASRAATDRILDTFSVTAPGFASQFAALEAFVDGDADDESAQFGAFALTGLQDDMNAAVRAAISSAKAQNIRLALLVTPPSVEQARAEPTSLQPPQQPLPPSLPPSQPIFSSGTCHASEDACTNATDACSGRGACASMKRGSTECFVCACKATKDSKGRKQDWAGDKCQKLDVSGTFVLITGTVLVITLVAGASIALLASVGSAELPSVLAGISGVTAQRH